MQEGSQQASLEILAVEVVMEFGGHPHFMIRYAGYYVLG